MGRRALAVGVAVVRVGDVRVSMGGDRVGVRVAVFDRRIVEIVVIVMPVVVSVAVIVFGGRMGVLVTVALGDEEVDPEAHHDNGGALADRNRFSQHHHGDGNAECRSSPEVGGLPGGTNPPQCERIEEHAEPEGGAA